MNETDQEREQIAEIEALEPPTDVGEVVPMTLSPEEQQEAIQLELRQAMARAAAECEADGHVGIGDSSQLICERCGQQLPLNIERLDAMLFGWQVMADKQVIDEVLQNEVGAIARHKVLIRIEPSGVTKDSLPQLKTELRKHIKALDLGKEALLDIEGGQPLALPSELEVVAGDLGIGPNRRERRRK